MRSLLIGVVVVAVVGGCAALDQPLPTDSVRDANAAIAVGKKVCGDADGPWAATFRLGIWYVEHRYPHEDQKCNWQRVQVWADTGKPKAKGCEECAVVT